MQNMQPASSCDSGHADRRKAFTCFSLGVIFRSSVWLGFPGFIANISVANATDMWPSAFCVGSAVGTKPVLSCLLCSWGI